MMLGNNPKETEVTVLVRDKESLKSDELVHIIKNNKPPVSNRLCEKPP
jgi:hypothetical protein